MDARELRALQIAATLPIKRRQHAWVVPSQTGHGSYTVVHPTLGHLEGALHGLTCTCPDFEERQLPCKHVLAVEYVVKREHPNGTVVTETIRVTYGQTWTAYNAAQCEEKERFMPMLADLCSTLSRPYSGKGRPPLPLSDMAFACVSRVYSGLSARRFDTDVREAKAKGLRRRVVITTAIWWLGRNMVGWSTWSQPPGGSQRCVLILMNGSAVCCWRPKRLSWVAAV